ncbi:MAG TPA: TonB-dependent receptor [Anaeromyxobacter sp.]|nr:TonB-dependent receptor [Anaeromyxobacter sp.]
MDEVEVHVPRPVSKDPTEDTSQTRGERVRESTRTSTFQAVAQDNADVYVPAGGVALHGVSNGATGGIRVRGLGGSPNTQVLVVEDGVPDYQGIFGHPIADAYIPTLIDEVLVVKGGDSVLYGTNALAGALIIRSRWLGKDGVEVDADSAAGSYSTLREQVAVLSRSGSWDVAAGLFALDTKGHRDGAGGCEVIGVGAVRYWMSPALSLVIRNKTAHLEGNDPGPVTHPTTDHWYDVWRDTASLQLDYRGDGFRLTFTPYLNAGIHKLYDGFYSHDYVGGAVAEGEAQVARGLGLLAGLSAEGVGGKVENQITGDNPHIGTRWSSSAYGQATWLPTPALTLVAGAREMVSSAYGSIPLYKGGARWDFLPGLYLRAAVAKNFRQPTLRELYLPYPTANPDLRPERALNADLGLGFESTHLAMDVSGYRTEATNLIKYFGEFPAAEVVNIDRVVIWGTEASLILKSLGPFSAYLSGDWQNVGRYTRQNPDARVTFGVEATDRLLTVSTDGEWVHDLFMSDYGRDRIPDVFVLNASARCRWELAGRKVALGPYLLVRNLLDRQYAYVAGYVMPGFNVLVGLLIEV